MESLNILKQESNANLTMVMNQNETSKFKVDLVTEIATQNGIDLSKIDGISKVHTIVKFHAN